MQVRLFSRKQVHIAAASGVEEAGVKVPTPVLLFFFLIWILPMIPETYWG